MRAVVTIASYRDAAIQRLIQTVKYASVRDAADVFLVLIRDAFERAAMAALRAEAGEAPILLPIPLHWRRIAERGFNQSACIADALCRMGWGTVARDGVVVRRKCRLPQALLPHERRFENVAQAFTCADAEALRGRQIVIVDDVVTTGATLAACARELRRVGIGPAWGFAIARG